MYQIARCDDLQRTENTASHNDVPRPLFLLYGFTQYIFFCLLIMYVYRYFFSLFSIVVKRRSMWDDNTPSSSSLSSSSGLLPATTVTSTSQAIDTLTISIKQDVTRLNSTLDHLQEYIDQRKTESQSNGTKSLVSSSTSSSYAQGKTNSGVVVPDLLSSSQGISHGDIVISSLKNQLLSFSLSLRDALTVRGDGIKHIADRRQVFGRMANRDLGRPLTFPSSSSPHDNKQGNDSTAITIVMNDGKNNSSSVVYGGGSSSSNQHNRQAYDAASLSNAATAPLLPSNSSAASSFALMTQAQLEPEAAYLASRAQDVRQVEAAVSEISTLFGRLAHLVSEQNSQIERIDQDIESADQRIHDAQTQLQKYYERVSSNKLLILKVLSILVFFIILFSIFVA